MSCIFCGHSNHVSHNCNVYASEKERKEILRLKNCCRNCLATFDGEADRIEQDTERCVKCDHKQRCYICFSKDHNTVYCPDWLTASNFFSPNIDKDLLPRFIKLLSIEDKYSLVFSFTINFNLITLPSFKVSFHQSLILSNIKNFTNTDFLVVDSATVGYNPRGFDFNNFTLGSIGISISKTIIFRIKHLEILLGKLFSSELLRLLSSKTKTLKCSSVEFSPKLKCIEILQTAPNVEEMYIDRTNIETGNSWPDDLLQLNHVKKLKKICYPITEVNFDIEKVAALMKKNHVLHISLTIVVPPHNHFDGKAALEIISNKLSKFFIPTPFVRSQSLTIFYADCSFSNIVFRKYELKNY